ncbi:MAG: hypothetical protein ACPGYV_10370 [Phycisphaeraceae bacterium]
MDTTQTFEQWFQRADEALPALTLTARWVVVGVGVLLWLAGGRLLKAACIAGGLMLGMILGGLTMAFVESPMVAVGFMIGLGLLGALGAWLMFRTWIAFSAAIAFAIAAPAAVIVWQGVPAEQLSTDTEQAARQVESRYDTLSNQLSDQTRLQVQSLIQQGDRDALIEADGLLAEQGRAAWQEAKTAVFRNLEDVQSWWENSATSTQRNVGLAMLIGAGAGFVFGFLFTSYAAAIQSAMVGAVLIVIPGRELIATYLPDFAEYVPTTARGTIALLGLITLVGVAVQWTLHLRRVDKKT